MVETFYKIDATTKKRLYYKRYANGSVKRIDKNTVKQRSRGGDPFDDTLSKLVNILTGNQFIEQPTDDELDTPLKDFYIFSSHNTYCTGAQVALKNPPEVATEPYDTLLERFRGGCHEIDTSGLTKDGKDLQVWHALPGKFNTLSSKVALAGQDNRLKFGDIVKNIRDYVKKTPTCYPVIISIDMKNKKFDKMNIMSTIFQTLFDNDEHNDILWPPKESTARNAYSDSVKLGDVMGKILIKNGSWNVKKDKLKDLTTLWLNNRIAFPASSDMKSMEDGGWKKVKEIWLQSGKAWGWTATNVKPKYVRFYPKASELQSNNFSPVTPWVDWGVQMVALNMQTNDNYAKMNTLVFYNKPFLKITKSAKTRIQEICDYVQTNTNPNISYLTTIDRKCGSKDNVPKKISLKDPLNCKDSCDISKCSKKDDTRTDETVAANEDVDVEGDENEDEDGNVEELVAATATATGGRSSNKLIRKKVVRKDGRTQYFHYAVDGRGCKKRISAQAYKNLRKH